MPNFKEELKELLTDLITMELFEDPILWDGHVFSSSTIKKQLQTETNKDFIEHPLTRAHLPQAEALYFFISENDTENLYKHVAIDYIQKIFSYVETYLSPRYSRVVMCDCLPEKKFKDIIYLTNNIDDPQQIEINYFNFNANFWDSLRKNKKDFEKQGVQVAQTKEWNNKEEVDKIKLICGCSSTSLIIDDAVFKEIFFCVGALSVTKKLSNKKDYTLQAIIEFLECKEEFELLSAPDTQRISNNNERLTKTQYLNNKLKINFIYLLKNFFSIPLDLYLSSYTEEYRPRNLLGNFVFDTIKILLLCNIELSEIPLEIYEEGNIIYSDWVIKNKHVHRDPEEASLFWAVKNDDDEMVKFLVRKQKELEVNVNLRNEDGNTALSLALKYENFKMVDLLIQSKVDVNIKNNNGFSPIFIAVLNGHTQVVNLLIKAQANVNDFYKSGETPIWIASQNGHRDVIIELIKGAADPNFPNKDGITPIWIASAKGDRDVIIELIKAGADPNIPNKNGITPVCIASRNGHRDVIVELIKAGADPNIRNNNGVTPVWIASQNGHRDVIIELIKAGADLNIPNKEGITPIWIASLAGHRDVIVELIKAGADLNIPNKEGITPIWIASGVGHRDVIIELIIAGAEPNILNNEGVTPVWIASKNGHRDVIVELIKAGADLNIPKKYGITPIWIASKKGHRDVIVELIKAGADPNIPNKEGITPIWIASGAGHRDVIIELIKAGADPNISNNDGETPVWIASKKGHKEVIVELIKAGANAETPDKKDITPLVLAVQNKHTNVIIELEKYLRDQNQNKTLYLNWMIDIRKKNQLGCVPPLGSFVNEIGITIVKPRMDPY